MLSKNQVKLISSLKHKKYRNKHKLFVVEGEKGIKEFLNSDMEMVDLFATEDKFGIKFNEITDRELLKISQLSTPNIALALFKIPDTHPSKPNSLVLALDAVRDPGNLGTIIRLCDWFGISDIFCSEDTVDCFNAKVVQSTMGSLSRVNVHYLDLKKFLSTSDLPIYGTFMDGENLYNQNLPSKAVLIMGNEGKGISAELKGIVNHRISVPRLNAGDQVESLNVASATAICLSEFRRNIIEK